MKSTFMVPALALALALGLAACGGGKASFDVGVTVTGLHHPGLVLTNNGTDKAVAPQAKAGDPVTLSFPAIDYGTAYAVAIKKDAAGKDLNPAHQSCSVFNGSDTAGRLAVIEVSVVCSMNTFPLSGTVVGLAADGLVLTNGSTGGKVALAKDATTFAFAAPVAFGVTYGITVLTQPAGLTCSVSQNGTGTMADAAVTDIVVTCQAA